MGHKRWVKAFITLAVCLGSGFGAGQPEVAWTDTVIDQGWEFRQMASPSNSINGQWRPAQVPGDVHLDLSAEQADSRSFLSRQRSQVAMD